MLYYTIVTTFYKQKMAENTLVFGNPDREELCVEEKGYVEKNLYFTQEKIFSIRCRTFGGGLRKTDRIFVIKTASPGEKVRSVMGVNPGGHILLDVSGKKRVDTVVESFEQIGKKNIDIELLDEYFFNSIHIRINSNQSLSFFLESFFERLEKN